MIELNSNIERSESQVQRFNKAAETEEAKLDSLDTSLWNVERQFVKLTGSCLDEAGREQLGKT